MEGKSIITLIKNIFKKKEPAAAASREPRVWLTGDLHFGHEKDFLWGPRGYESSLAHDEAIIKNWNSVVESQDTVYVVGDVMLGNNNWGMYCLSKLKGNIKIIYGNHDTDTRKQLYPQLHRVECLGYATMIKKGKRHFYLSHRPTVMDNHGEAHQPWCICGHSHTKDCWADLDKRCYHVELDAHNNYPVLLDDIIEDIKAKRKEMIENED